MNRKLKTMVLMLCIAPAVMAQSESDPLTTDIQNEHAFTFTESQLDEDENIPKNIVIFSSNRNVYASEVGYRFSPARFKFRGYNSKYNDIYINGNPVNDIETGNFRYSFVGGLNNQTRSQEASLPFEDNQFMIAGMSGSNNYNFRPSSFATGQRFSIAGANRNYNTRAMYTYNTGMMSNGWAFTGSLTYRWGNGTGFVEGTSYNSLSYFLGAEKMINDQHSLSLVTWGNPTERGTQAASTDEMYWIANDRQYNSIWGYQNGKKRNSRVIKDFQPAAMLLWDWKIDNDTKLTTSLLGKYTMFSNSRLDYTNTTNPQPDYYSVLPSYHFNVWDQESTEGRDQAALDAWQASYDYLSASKANRQVHWDQMYFANRMVALQGGDAMYFLKRFHDDQLSLSLSSYLEKVLSPSSILHGGLQLSSNKGMHYQTMEDLLGATSFHNVNTYVTKTYGEGSQQGQYDLNNPNKLIGKGDRFGYDYNLLVNKAQAWAGISKDIENAHLFLNGRIAGTTMQRDGKMRNGLAPTNSYGKSDTKSFIDAGFKAGAHLDLGQGHAMLMGFGYESKAPAAKTAFQAAQVSNEFVDGLKNEKILTGELGYQLKTSWLALNFNAYFSHLSDVTEQSMSYSDSDRSFTYISLLGIAKDYYGLELGANFKVTEWLNIKALGTINEAKYINNAEVNYMPSEDGVTRKDIVLNKGMREGNTPLTAASIDLSYHANGWYIDLIGNYYDRIYLYYTPVTRYAKNQTTSTNLLTGETEYNDVPAQDKGKGGFMVDASIGRQFYLKHGHRLGVNLMITNMLNNLNIVTGGREQSRVKYEDGEPVNPKKDPFKNSPYKFYANGINGMLMINYYF